MGESEIPIDVVYTWVDGRDPEHQARRLHWLEQVTRSGLRSDLVDGDVAANRFIEHDELKYSLRSVERFAPWVRKIFIVTDGQSPAWLKQEHPRLRLVDHREIFPNHDHLPTFSSNAIECHLHRISDLSECFLYFNDDFFLGQQLAIADFFDGDETVISLKRRSAADRLRRMLRNVFGISSGVDKDAGQSPAGPWQTYQESASIVEEYPNCSSHYHLIKNTLDLLKDLFGDKPFLLPGHTVAPLRRSTMSLLEEMFPQQFEETSSSRFRSRKGIIPTYLCQSYMLEKGKGRISTLKTNVFHNCSFVPRWQFLLNMYRICRQEFSMFCFNDMDPNPEPWRHEKFNEVLNSLFPNSSSFEQQ